MDSYGFYHHCCVHDEHSNININKTFIQCAWGRAISATICLLQNLLHFLFLTSRCISAKLNGMLSMLLRLTVPHPNPMTKSVEQWHISVTQPNWVKYTSGFWPLPLWTSLPVQPLQVIVEKQVCIFFLVSISVISIIVVSTRWDMSGILIIEALRFMEIHLDLILDAMRWGSSKMLGSGES